MEHEPPRHEKVRFRRSEIADLAILPSAAEPHAVPAPPRRSRRDGRALALWLLSALLSLPLLLAGVAYTAGALGFGSERLRLEAEKAVEAFAGPGLDVVAGPARFTFGSNGLLALEMRDIGVRRTDGSDVLQAETVRFGIRILPLLAGKVRLSSAQLANARVIAPAGGAPDWTRALRGPEGLLDPDRISGAVFETVHSALDVMEQGDTRRVRFENVDFILPPDGNVRTVRLVKAALTGAGAGSLRLTAETEIDGRSVSINASADRDRVSRRITDLAVDVHAAGPAAVIDGRDRKGEGHDLGDAELRLSGSESGPSMPSRLAASVTLRHSAVDLGSRGRLAGDVDFQGVLVGGSGKIDVDRLSVTVGRSVLNFRGAVGPRPPTGLPGDRPAYRFDLISPESTIAPEDSPEPALEAYLRLTGVYLETDRNLTADEIVLKAGQGEVLGSLSARFVDGKLPGIAAAFSVHDMPVAQVKQLWPWFSARGARSWVLDNLFGGRVAEGRIRYRVEPGRMGDGIPLTAREVTGFFAVEGTRFDTAGLIPPVRDANGTIDFRGNDVDIALSSGMVFLPSGRTVAAGNGTMTVKNAHLSPVIGALDIDVAGDAPAIAELASYDPIDAMRLIGFSPEDFTGEVSGNVRADIPLQKGIEADDLGWVVALDYEDLSISKPVDGQMVTEAAGTITVEPHRAVVKAKAKLGGVEAEIDATEPLGGSTAERERLVKLVLDDEAREAIVPGISDLVKGKVEVALEMSDGKSRVEADLTAAELSIPWAGWTKGPGIAADVSFVLEDLDGKSSLSDFELSGKSFGVSGSLTLAEGSLAQATFSKVKLNRDDGVAVTVKRTGKGYAVDVAGSSLDARAIVKRFTAQSSASKTGGKASSVSITAEVGTMSGFHGERLSNVKLSYSGSRDRVDGLDISAVTASGQNVDIRIVPDGTRRTMRMRSTDAGALLRFLGLYEHMQGGNIDLALQGDADGPMSGHIDARDFWLQDEPRLDSLVSRRPPGERMSLNEAVKRDIDTSRVKFERGFTEIERGDGYLRLSNGVLRGPLLGFIFQGTLYDEAGNMNMTGTFMPAYGLNRIFGEIPLLGVLLGNGRDRGLIGVTFRLAGLAHDPELLINPLSVIAPGIFRSIFEFR